MSATENFLRWAHAADRIYAADSGADALLPLGLKPVVVGDLDSVTSDLSGLRVVEDPDQDFSDCDKLLRLVYQEIESPDLVIAGLEGDRLDHMLASISSLLATPLSSRVLLETGLAYPLSAPTVFRPPVADGTTVSLLPMGHCLASMRHCRWPLDRRNLALGEFHSVSNVAHQGFEVELHDGQALLIVTGPHEPW